MPGIIGGLPPLQPPLDTLVLIRPDDWHVHLRDGPVLVSVVPDTARRFGRAIVMPNLKPPVATVAAAIAYRGRILAAVPPGAAFTPLMTLYLTDRTTADEIRAAASSGIVHAVKYYPAGATTNSDSGVTDIARAYPALAAMEIAAPVPFASPQPSRNGAADWRGFAQFARQRPSA